MGRYYEGNERGLSIQERPSSEIKGSRDAKKN